MAKVKTLEVTFLHPRTDSRFRAEVGEDLTARQALDELVKAGFLDAPSASSSYFLQLQRTGQTIPLSSSITFAGVKSDDELLVCEPQG